MLFHSSSGRTALVAGLVLAAPLGAQVGSPAGAVPAHLLQARRAALLEALGGSPAVITSAEPKSIEGDYPQDSDFRQSNDFFYLTGLEAAGAWLTLNLPEPDDIVLYLPPRDAREEVWTGKKLGPGPEASSLSGIGEVRSAERMDEELTSALSKGGGAGPGRRSLFVSLGDPSHRETLEALAVGPGGASFSSAGSLIGPLRRVKDKDEIRRLRRAISITGEAISEAMRSVQPGDHEYEIEAVIEYVFRMEGAERLGFPSIVASGPNGTVLHYDENRRRSSPGDLVVTDVGAEFGYYSADVTRTFPVSGRFTPRQRALYQLVLDSQQAALDKIRPGVTVQELERSARDYMTRHSGELCGERPCTSYFVHGLSHWLGMDVHDVGGYGVPLAPGMVLTVEPGVYLPQEGLGIRIEDDVLVTPDGYELLSSGVPREADRIEALIREEPEWVRGDRQNPVGGSDGQTGATDLSRIK